MTSHRIEPPPSCPHCARVVDAATPVDDEHTDPPAPGDWSVCFYCGTVLEFGEGMTVREIGPDAIDDPEAKARIMEARKIIMQRERG